MAEHIGFELGSVISIAPTQIRREEFESDMASHAVGLSRERSRIASCRSSGTQTAVSSPARDTGDWR
jgi:hypothetical protein